jgi:peptidyl-prolyl cis-trans isomerase B (cyclophilin B)
MSRLRNDSRVFGCGLGVLASVFFCFTVATAAADDLDLPGDPLLAAIDAFIAQLDLDKSDKEWKSKVPAPGATGAFDPVKIYYWNLETNRGDLKIELFPKSAPLHVLSTIYLTQMGFYDDVKFHRIVTDFVVQGGDPTGTGNGGPGYRYGGEFDPDLSHTKKGIVSMANAGPGTDGSQFFITLSRATKLNGKHTIFGQLVEGKPTLSKLGKAGSKRGKPKRKAVIKKATITVEPATP